MQKKLDGKVFWFTGLSGAGKTTLALALKKELEKKYPFIFVLDGDIMRQSLSKNLGFSEADRKENVRRTAEVAQIIKAGGGIVCCCMMSPTYEMREMAKEIVGESDFFEIFIQTSIETCIARDTKGLYKKALNGEIQHISGLDAPFDVPKKPFLVLNTDADDFQTCFTRLTEAVFATLFNS